MFFLCWVPRHTIESALFRYVYYSERSDLSMPWMGGSGERFPVMVAPRAVILLSAPAQRRRSLCGAVCFVVHGVVAFNISGIELWQSTWLSLCFFQHRNQPTSLWRLMSAEWFLY